MRRKLYWVPAIAAMAGILCAAGARAQDAKPATAEEARDYIGQWVMQIDSPQGLSTGALNIMAVSGKVAAEFTFRAGADAQKITDVTKSDSGLTLKYEANFGGQSFDMIMALKRDSGGLSGTLSDAAGQFEIDVTGVTKEVAEGLSEAEEGLSDEEVAASIRRRLFRRYANTTLDLGDDKSVEVRFGETATDHADFAALEATKAGQVFSYTGSFATKLITDETLDFGGTKVKKENVATDYPGVYSLWLKKTADGWSLVFNNESDVWGTMHNADADAAEVALAHSMADEATEKFAVKLDEEAGTLNLAWGKHVWSAPFTVEGQ